MTTVRIDPGVARRRTAQLMTQAQQEIPLFHLGKLAEATTLRARAGQNGVSVTVALLPIVARWLARFPLLNGRWTGDLEVRDRIDLGIAWSYAENVLVVPTLRDCGEWGIAEFATAMSDLRERARGEALLPTDFATPSFTVSNLGAFGVDQFTSLVTPPQVAVLSVSALDRRPVARGEAIVLAHTLPLTLGADHRAVDGAYAARALSDLASHIQEPGDEI
jgi:pyruvate dehydrogenase E2 component (dihydrolipoamide acetyltransferase)